MIITMDGPAGSGKSTVAKLVAQKLHAVYIDSGSLYRAIAYMSLREHVDVRRIGTAVKKWAIVYTWKNNKAHVRVNGLNVTDFIRSEDVSKQTSLISKDLQVRAYVTHIQRSIAHEAPLVVIEGRDSGSVVFPHAEYKFFITASIKERARRRYKELRARGDAKGDMVTMTSIYNAIKARDHQDMNRAHSPLTRPQGSYVLWTTYKSINQVVDDIVNIIHHA